jgi:signal recognition particle receptor subunit beta
MPQLNVSSREIALKLVYYGPALSGKTTNLQQIHKMLAPTFRGEMITLDTQEDRTLYFDFLPIEFGTSADFRIKLKLFTVPGQVLHRTTRRVVLGGADAVAFIADSQRSAASANAYSYRDLETTLRANGIDPEGIARVIQFNKRDLPDIKPMSEIREAWSGTGIPTVPAVALKGEGVVETFQALLERLYQSIDRRHDFSSKFGVRQEDFLDGVFHHLEAEKSERSDGS